MTTVKDILEECPPLSLTCAKAHRITVALENWDELVRWLSERPPIKEVLWALSFEWNHDRRQSMLMRLYSRFNQLRAERDREVIKAHALTYRGGRAQETTG